MSLFIHQWLDTLDSMGNTDAGMMRLCFSAAEIAAKNYIAGLMRQYGMEVRYDAAANLIGRIPGLKEDAPVVAVGSHLDSVPHGGRYDGVLGVLSGLEVARHIFENGLKPYHSFEVIAFSNEEGARYVNTLFGSEVMMGTFPSAKIFDDALYTDSDGIPIAQALRQAGGDPENLASSARPASDFKAFLELHIEQGAVLDSLGIPLGVVTGIAAPVRYSLKLTGRADHAGATPMKLRKDALAGAAEIILALERLTPEAGPAAVGTVGRILVEPNALNIISGAVTVWFDLRDSDLSVRNSLVASLRETVKQICLRRGLTEQWTELASLTPVGLNESILALIEDSCHSLGFPSHRMVSGAAHDAMTLARNLPVGMIFVPSVDGVSHSPKEKTRPADIDAGVAVLKETVLKLLEK